MRKLSKKFMIILAIIAIMIIQPISMATTDVVGEPIEGAGGGGAASSGKSVSALIGEYTNGTSSAPANSSVIRIANDMSGAVITIAKVACAGVAVIMIIVLAMKYMVSSVEDRATIKKHAIVYVVGAIIMFSAAGILQIIENFASQIS